MTTPSQHDIVAAAQALRPQITAARDEIEESRRLPPDLIAAMDRAGLFRIYVPRSLGGPETDPLTAFRAVEQLSIADGSVGWCSFIAGAICLYSGWLEPAVAREIFGCPSALRGAGSFRPLGAARPVNGGYLAAGQWDFASGCQHANWLFLNCLVTGENGPRQTPDGLPLQRMMTIPIESAQIIDHWTVSGLRGTGSHDVAIANLFVPENRTFALTDPPIDPAPLCHPRAAMVTTFTLLAANTLGIARGAMDAFIELAGAKATTMNPALLRDRPPAQHTAGRAEAIISGARAYLLTAIGALWQAIQSNQPDLSQEVLQGRLAVTHAVHESARAIDLLYHAAGTNAPRRDNRLERPFRDIHAAMMHAGGLPANFEQAGRITLGLPPAAPGW